MRRRRAEAFQAIDAARIRALADGDVRVEVVDAIGSTNDVLKERLKRHVLDPSQADFPATFLVALRQERGRGRQGKSFFSPAHTGLYCSLAFTWDEALPPVHFTLLAAASLRRSLARCGLEVGIKFVNDLIREGSKVCGILTEGVLLPGGRQGIVLGFGLNLLDPPDGWPPELAGIAGSLWGKELPAASDLNEFLAMILSGLLADIAAFRTGDTAHLAAYCEGLLLHAKAPRLYGEQVLAKKYEAGELSIRTERALHRITGDEYREVSF